MLPIDLPYQKFQSSSEWREIIKWETHKCASENCKWIKGKGKIKWILQQCSANYKNKKLYKHFRLKLFPLSFLPIISEADGSTSHLIIRYHDQNTGLRNIPDCYYTLSACFIRHLALFQGFLYSHSHEL